MPALLVSYERAIDRPEETVEQLAGFLGLPAPQDLDRVRDFVRPGSYQDVQP